MTTYETHLWRWICCLALSTTALVCAAGNNIRCRKLNGVNYLYLSDVASFYGLRYTVQGKKLFLTSRTVTIGLTAENRLMLFNGVQVYLSRAIAEEKGIYFLSQSDLLLLLHPYMRKAAVPRHGIRKIVIDPGHGGRDVGAMAGNVQEKKLNLQVALKLAALLRQKGFVVFMTRAADKDVTLEQRTNFANRVKADLYVSIHCNSASPAINGLEVFVATPAGECNTGEFTVQNTACAANSFDKLNNVLAFTIQSNMLSKVKMADRGIRHRRFYVIRNTACPSILVELGFISNAHEREQLKLPAVQQAMAEAMANGIVLFRNITKATPKR